MKKQIILTVLVLILLVGCGGDSKEEAEWERFDFEEGNFSIMFPEEPEGQTESVPTAIGTLETRIYMVEQKDMAFLVNFVDYPPEVVEMQDVQTMLDGGVQGAVSNVGGTLLNQRDLTLNGHPGREIQAEATVEGEEVVFKARIYIVENRLYMIQALSYKADASSPDLDKFLDSFQLK